MWPQTEAKPTSLEIITKVEPSKEPLKILFTRFHRTEYLIHTKILINIS